MGISFKHQANVLPGKGHAYAEGTFLIYDYNGTHSVSLQVKERRIRAGSESSKAFTPTGIRSTFDMFSELENKKKIDELYELLESSELKEKERTILNSQVLLLKEKLNTPYDGVKKDG